MKQTTKTKYAAIKKRYKALNIKKGNVPVHTHSYMLSVLAEEFFMSEGTIGKVLIMPDEEDEK